MAQSYHFYFLGNDFDGIVPNYTIRLWLTPFGWFAATWFVHELTTASIPPWLAG